MFALKVGDQMQSQVYLSSGINFFCQINAMNYVMNAIFLKHIIFKTHFSVKFISRINYKKKGIIKNFKFFKFIPWYIFTECYILNELLTIYQNINVFLLTFCLYFAENIN